MTALRENTYVDNIMQTGNNIDKLEKFKKESEVVLESAKLPIHKWESNIATLEDENMPNPSKILGHVWDKREDTLEIQVPAVPETSYETKHLESAWQSVRPIGNNITHDGRRKTHLQRGL